MKKFGILILILGIIFLYKVDSARTALFNTLEYAVVELYDKVDKFIDKKLNNSSEGYDDNTSKEQYMKEQASQNYDNYKNIKIGDNFDSVVKNIGRTQKVESSEYDFKWHVYADDYDKFFMVGVYDNKVVALFSNCMDSNETNIKLGTTKGAIRKSYEPLEYRKIGNTRYFSKETYYDIVEEGSNYVTVFYDEFDGNKVLGIQIVSKEMEARLTTLYSSDQSRVSSFENINRYVLNAERNSRGLNTLNYQEQVTLCARSHSEDMAANDFFSHNNLKGQTPFDRMKSYDIDYRAAAENIAAGQTSTIFMHYALLNSKGHRVNMLGEYNNIGVGVCIGGSMKLYLTQNFYR